MQRFTLLFIAILLGCSSSNATVIRATEGGTVTTSTHEVAIPPGSLVEDTEVVIRTADISDFPTLTDARPEALLLEPSGTVLEVAADVTIRNRFIDAAEGDQVEIYQLIEGADGGWVRRESTVTESGRRISVTRFSPLAVVVRSAPEGSAIRGRVQWSSGTPADGVPLELWRADSLVNSTVTDAEGAFTFGELEPGTYQITTDLECPLSETVTVAAGEIAEPTLTLCGS